MSAGYRAVLADLRALAATFHTAAADYAALMPVAGLPPVATGDPAADAVLGAVLECVGALHTRIAVALADHGGRLDGAAATYSRVDMTVRELFDQLVPGS